MDVECVLIESLKLAATNSSNLNYVKGVHKKTAIFAK